jgi:GNAT superfamily N-acetyltransferase
LVERAWEETIATIPEYNHHGDVINAYWSRLNEERPEFQFYLVGDDDEILARGHSVPLRWDGGVDDLPAGIDGAIARGFEGGGANVLCAMLIAIPPSFQGRGLSPVALQAMRELAHRHGLIALIALKDPGSSGGSDVRLRPGGRRCSCDGETEEVSR